MTVSCNVACFDSSSILEATIGGTGVIEISDFGAVDGYYIWRTSLQGAPAFPLARSALSF